MIKIAIVVTAILILCGCVSNHSVEKEVRYVETQIPDDELRIDIEVNMECREHPEAEYETVSIAFIGCDMYQDCRHLDRFDNYYSCRFNRAMAWPINPR